MWCIKSLPQRLPSSLAKAKPDHQESTLRLDLARRLHETLAQDLAVIGYKLDEIIGEADLDKNHRLALRKIRFALSETTKSFRDQIYQLRLTSRELEILEKLPTGDTVLEIAAQLFVTESTVKTHLASIYKKFGAKNRVQCINAARKIGLLP